MDRVPVKDSYHAESVMVMMVDFDIVGSVVAV